MAKDRITITIDDDLLLRIDALAEQRGLARSAMIDQLLSEAVIEEELVDTQDVQALLGVVTSPALLKTLSTLLGNALDEDQMRVVSRKLTRMRRPGGGRRKDTKETAAGVQPDGNEGTEQVPQ